MDYYKAISELHAEKVRLDQIITTLEGVSGTKSAPTGSRRRGRHAMPAEEREKVSERMRTYWAARREQKLSS